MANTIDVEGNIPTFRKIVQRTITEYEDNTLIRLRQYAFAHCSLLTRVSLSALTSCGVSAFSECTSLTDVDLSSLAAVAGYLFSGCTALEEIELPSATTIPDDYVFWNCTSLRQVSLPKLTSMRYNIFSGCTNLETLYIGTDNGGTVCSISGGNLSGLSSLQAIYVPDALVQSYQAATGWTNYASIIFGVSSAPDA